MSTVKLTAEAYPALSQAATVVLDFHATWCEPCHAFAPAFAHASDENPDVVFATVDVDEEPELSARFEVEAVPTIVALREGVVVFRRAGVLSLDILQSLVDRIRGLVPVPTPTATLSSDGMSARSAGLPPT